MFKLHASRIAMLALVASLAACGGGGDDNSAGLALIRTKTPPATAEGLYSGSSSNGFQIASMVLDNGEYYVVYGKAGTGYGVVQGNGTSVNGAFSSTNGLDFVGGQTPTPVTISATYAAKRSLQGTVTGGRQSFTFTAAYDPIYDTPASIASIVGTYSGASVTGSGVALIKFTVAANGSFSGTSTVGSSVCSHTGTLAPPAGAKNVFNLSMTFGDSGCGAGTATASGYAVPDLSGSTPMLLAMGVLADRSDGVLVIGTRQ